LLKGASVLALWVVKALYRVDRYGVFVIIHYQF